MVNPGRKLKKMLLILGIAGAVYGGFKYLLPLVIPFLCAYVAALWLRPSVRYFERRLKWKIGRTEIHASAAAVGAIEIVLIFGVLIGLVYICGNRLFQQLERFTAAIPLGLIWLDGKLTGLCRNAEHALGLKEDHLVAIVREMIRELGVVLRQSSMPALMNNSMTVLSWIVNIVIVSVIFFIAALMFLQEMDEIRERKNRSMFHREFALIGRRLVTVGSAWLKTEAILIAVTSSLCTIGLLFVGNPYALLLGIGIGLLDALPLFGAGAVLIPWGLVMLVQKQWMNGVILLGLYVVCYFSRQILEAKLMGTQVGLTPIETLVSMYVGLQLFGLTGFLLGPIGLLLIEDLVDYYWREFGENEDKIERVRCKEQSVRGEQPGEQ